MCKYTRSYDCGCDRIMIDLFVRVKEVPIGRKYTFVIINKGKPIHGDVLIYSKIFDKISYKDQYLRGNLNFSMVTTNVTDSEEARAYFKFKDRTWVYSNLWKTGMGYNNGPCNFDTQEKSEANTDTGMTWGRVKQMQIPEGTGPGQSDVTGPVGPGQSDVTGPVGVADVADVTGPVGLAGQDYYIAINGRDSSLGGAYGLRLYVSNNSLLPSDPYDIIVTKNSNMTLPIRFDSTDATEVETGWKGSFSSLAPGEMKTINFRATVLAIRWGQFLEVYVTQRGDNKSRTPIAILSYPW